MDKRANFKADKMNTKAAIHINVWSDYVCPYCYLEIPVIDKAIDIYGDRITIQWRAFELRPEPVPTLQPDGDYLRTTWDRSVYPMAEQRGMILRLPPVQPRSRKAFEAAAFARDNGFSDEMRLALFKAFFEQGLDLGDIAVLTTIGAQVGLEPENLRRALENAQYTEEVAEDTRLARDLGISGVPAMMIGPSTAPLEQAVLVSGAQKFGIVRAAIERVLRAR